jgi:hypothetical protein
MTYTELKQELMRDFAHNLIEQGFTPDGVFNMTEEVGQMLDVTWAFEEEADGTDD